MNENLERIEKLRDGQMYLYAVDLVEILTNMEKRIKALEQGYSESKHDALLNNCVDDDEVILREREIEEVSN